jgi:DNA-binding NarL/FixJ family response regulator
MVPLIRTAVVDDHPAMRAGLAAVLSNAPDLAPAGEAASGAELWPLIERTAPQVILMDWHLPGEDGLVLCHRVKRHRSDIRVVLFSAYADAWLVGPALLAQADALLAKRAPAPVVYETVRSVAARKGPPEVELTADQRAAVISALDPEDVGIAGMLLIGTPLSEIARHSGQTTSELGKRVEAMLLAVTAAHGPAVTYDADSG